MNQTTILYPAIVYKNNKSNVFIANCIIKKLVGYGRSEYDAINNLERMMNKNNSEFPVKIKPVYNFLSENDLSIK